MMVLYILAFIIGVTWIASFGPLLGYSIDYGVEELENFFNPIVKYESGDFNFFGAAILTALLNLLFMPMALIYWFYKLCTVGRR